MAIIKSFWILIKLLNQTNKHIRRIIMDPRDIFLWSEKEKINEGRNCTVFTDIILLSWNYRF